MYLDLISSDDEDEELLGIDAEIPGGSNYSMNTDMSRSGDIDMLDLDPKTFEWEKLGAGH
jgi:hypothetical protein